MTKTTRVSISLKWIGVSTAAVASICIGSCCPPHSAPSPPTVQEEFAAQHGFKPSDYWGTEQNVRHVPADAID